MTWEHIQLPAGGCWVLPPRPPDPSNETDVEPVPTTDFMLEAPAGLSLHARSSVDGTLTLYDSWTWSLWHSGRLMVGDGLSLRVFDARAPGAAIASLPLAEPPRFARDLPAGPLAKLVRPLLGRRALLPVASVTVRQRQLDILNEDDKVVARLLEQSWADDLRTVALMTLRGYEDEVRSVRKALPPDLISERHPIAIALETAGIQPRVWTNKPAFTFEGSASSHPVVVEMLSTLVGLGRQTEEGIVDDIDTEFVHDYRVLLRKARSVVALTDGVFEPEATAKLKEQLRVAAQRTNELRDLDVHLMEEFSQTQRVPSRLQPGLTHLFDDLRARRSEVHASVAKVLAGAGYRKTMTILAERIATAPAGPRAEQSIRKLIDKRVSRQLTKVLKRGRAIGPDTPDEAVHALRIECKKLRYLLEFFRHLYSEARLSPVTKALKRLQDVLGRFNDRSVQQEELHHWVMNRAKVGKATVLSIGALIGALAAEQTALRVEVEAAFAAFDDAHRRGPAWGKAKSPKKEIA